MIFSDSNNNDDIFGSDGQGQLFDPDHLGGAKNPISKAQDITRGSDYSPGEDHDQLMVDAIKMWSNESESLLEFDKFASASYLRKGEEWPEDKKEQVAIWEKTLAAFMYEVESNKIDPAATLYRGQPFNFDHPTDRIRSWSKEPSAAAYFALNKPYLIKENGEEVPAPSLKNGTNRYGLKIEPGDKLVVRGYRSEGVPCGLDLNKRAAEISITQMIQSLQNGAISVSCVQFEDWENKERSPRSIQFGIAEEKAQVAQMAIKALGVDLVNKIAGEEENFFPGSPEEDLIVSATGWSFDQIDVLIRAVEEKPGMEELFKDMSNFWDSSKNNLMNQIENEGKIVWTGGGSVADYVIKGEREIITHPEFGDDLRTIDVVVAKSNKELFNMNSYDIEQLYMDSLKEYHGAPSERVAYNQRPFPGLWEGELDSPGGLGGGLSGGSASLATGAGAVGGMAPGGDLQDIFSSNDYQSPSTTPPLAGSGGKLSPSGPAAGGGSSPSSGGEVNLSGLQGGGAASGPGSSQPGNSMAKPTIGAGPGKDPLSSGQGADAAEARISQAKKRGAEASGKKSPLSKIAGAVKKGISRLVGAKAMAKKAIVALAPYWPVLLLFLIVMLLLMSFSATALGLGREAFDKLIGQKGAYDSLNIPEKLEKEGKKAFGESAAVAFDCNSLDPAERRPAPAENANCIEGLFSAWQNAEEDYFSPIPKSAGWLIPAYRGAGRYYSLPWQLFGAINGARSSFGKPNCAENRGPGRGIGFMKTSPSSWARFSVNAGSSKLESISSTGACKEASEPLKIFEEYKKRPNKNPVSREPQRLANFYDPADAIYTEGNELASLGARFEKQKEWDYTGSSSNSCTVPKQDGKIFYAPMPSFDLAGGFSGIQGNGKTLRISAKLVKLGDFYKKKWGGQSVDYKGAIPKKILVKMLTEIWLAFGANERQAKINAQANYKQVKSESGGRPYASQGMCDANGCPGDPNVAGGLLQFIPGTFDTWKVAGFNDRFNAVDNLLAGVNAQVNGTGIYTTGALDGGGPRKVKILAGQGGWGVGGSKNPYKNKSKVIISNAALSETAKPTPYRGKPQTDKISKAILAQGYSPCYVAIIHDWYKMILKFPPEESIGASLLPGGVKRVSKPKKLVKCPKNIPQDTSNPCYIDARVLSNMVYLSKTFQVNISDAYSGPLPGGGAAGCYASGYQCHSEAGEHPLGVAIDGVPAKGSWAPIDKLAKITEPIQNAPKPPFRWVGYNGDSNHGSGHHIHLSWEHSGAPPYKLPDWVLVFGTASAPGGKGAQFNRKFAKQFGSLSPESPNKTMRTAARITAEFEGFPNNGKPYNDPVGHCTIGYGHLIHYGGCTRADFKKWGRLSDKEAKNLLIKDLTKFNRYVSQYIKVPLTSNMRAALISFTFNLGPGGLKDSTLRKKLNNKNYIGASKEFKRFVYAGGVVFEGLVRRREAERKLFLKGSAKFIKRR